MGPFTLLHGHLLGQLTLLYKERDVQNGDTGGKSVLMPCSDDTNATRSQLQDDKKGETPLSSPTGAANTHRISCLISKSGSRGAVMSEGRQLQANGRKGPQKQHVLQICSSQHLHCIPALYFLTLAQPIYF